MPPYVEWFALAKVLQKPIEALADTDPYLIQAARAMLHAQALVDEARHQKVNKPVG